jgi:protein involved in polysaccharide export with SLBB domain
MSVNYKQFIHILLITVPFIIFGQSLQDLKKLKSEYEKSNNQTMQNDIQITNDEQIESNMSPEEIILVPFDQKTNVLNPEKKFFGYDFFTQRDSISIFSNLPAPSNYKLGPGDEIIISLWGETQIRNTYLISREGKIYDDKVGLLNLNAKTIQEARKYLKNQFGRIYSTINGSSPTTFIDVSIGELKSINVNFVGAVKFPGVYSLHSFSNVITGLIQIGGVDTLGSLRSLKVKRNGQIISSLDLYDFFINGNLSSSIQLQDQDIVIVPPRKSFVIIDSAVVRPGIYESIEGENLCDLIQHAGGLTFDSNNKLAIKSLSSFDKRKIGNNYSSTYLDYSNCETRIIENKDEIIAYFVFKEIKSVEILGQVKAPGFYFYYEGMTLYDLIEMSGGFNDSSFLKSVYLDKAEIIRRDPFSKYEQIIDFNVEEIINNNNDKKVFLQNLDRVVIHANLNYFEKTNVIIQGEINVPGYYPLISDDENLESLILRSGGLTTNALDNGISIFRDKEFVNSSSTVDTLLLNIDYQNKIRLGWQNQKITLMPGDSIIVKKASGSVNVLGEIYNPGMLEYNSGKSLWYYINSAGGLTEKANKRGIIVVYPNGTVKPQKIFSYPKIYDGTTIVINSKREEPPFNLTQFATNWTTIITSMITAIILSRQLSTSSN